MRSVIQFMLGATVFGCVAAAIAAATPPTVVSAEAVAFDSVKVKFEWQQPQDGRGNADSTLFRVRVSKPWRTYASTTVKNAATWYRIVHGSNELADSLKLALTTIGDSVIFEADSIRQCRRGVCSVPGSASFRYVRPDNPPPMTFLRVITDSF